MPAEKTPAEIAERLQKRRARLMLLFPVLFIVQQSQFWANHMHDAPLRAVDRVQIAAYAFWSISLLALLATGGGLFRSRAVQDLLSDELTRAHRGFAYAVGFWTVILACLTLYVFSMFQPLSLIAVLHLLLTSGVFASCITFAVLELRAARG
jgi:magnesium-transporting ATPase (P-type)